MGIVKNKFATTKNVQVTSAMVLFRVVPDPAMSVPDEKTNIRKDFLVLRRCAKIVGTTEKSSELIRMAA